MVSVLVRFVFVLSLVTCLTTQSFAQSGSNESHPTSSGPRKQLATILFAGLGGAILGLSTLSFYGRPQDKLSNIAFGFAFGVITGTAIVTYKAATNPAEIYGLQLHDQYGRERWALGPSTPPVGTSWRFEF